MTLQIGRGRGRGRRRGRRPCGNTIVVKEDIPQSVTGRENSSGYDSFARTGFVRLSKEASTSVWMWSTLAERLSRTQGHNNETKSLSIRVMVAAERLFKDTTERNDPLLQLNYYKVSKENMQRKVSEQELLFECNDGVSEAPGKETELPTE